MVIIINFILLVKKLNHGEKGHLYGDEGGAPWWKVMSGQDELGEWGNRYQGKGQRG